MKVKVSFTTEIDESELEEGTDAIANAKENLDEFLDNLSTAGVDDLNIEAA